MGKRWRASVLCMVGVAVFVAGCAKKPEPEDKPPKGQSVMEAPATDGRRVRPRPAPPSRSHFRWPKGYVQKKVIALSAAQVHRIGQTLGGRLTGVSNYFLQHRTGRLQVNVIEAATEADGKRVLQKLQGRSFGSQARFERRGRLVVELVGGRPRQWHRFMRALNLLDRSPRRYRVTARFGLLRRGDAADVNVIFNLALNPRPGEAKWKAAWDKLRGRMRFGNTLRLRLAPTAQGKPVYGATPRASKAVSEGVQRVLSFTNAKKLHGIPYVDLVAEVGTKGWSPNATAKPPGKELTAATPAWPTKDSAVQAIVKKLVTVTQSSMARLAVLHAWVNRRIRRGGRQGSRDGTLAVLKRGFGRCGDSADVMITLARAAGLPARLVAGWIVDGPGHYWAEVHVAPVGWISVDATAPWVGVSGRYVPLMISETGPLPLMHLRMPKFERLR